MSDVPTVVELFPGSTTGLFLTEPWPGWFPMNVSVAEGPAGFAAIVACNDLIRHDDGSYNFGNPDHVIHTRNIFARLNDSLEPCEPWTELHQPNVPVLHDWVRGIECPRLYWGRNEWMYSGNIFEHDPSGLSHQAICSVEDGLLSITPPDGVEQMKNLMPTGETFLDAMRSNPSYHGGAVVSGGWGDYIAIVHEILWPGRRYVHRFVRLDAKGELMAATEQFKFDPHQLEVAAGIVLHGDDLVVSYSVQDREAWLARVPLYAVLEALIG